MASIVTIYIFFNQLLHKASNAQFLMTNKLDKEFIEIFLYIMAFVAFVYEFYCFFSNIISNA